MSRQPAAQTTTSRQQLQRIIADLSEGVILLDTKGRILWANPAALKMHGCEHTAELGCDAADYTKQFVLHHPHRHQCETTPPLQQRLEACEEFRNMTLEITQRGHRQTERLLKVTGRVLMDQQRHPASQVLIIDDITRRADAESRFDQAFSLTTAPAVILRLSDAHFVEANNGFLALTEFRKQDVVDRPLHDINVLHGAEHRSAAIRALNAHQPIPEQELHLPTKSGDDKRVIMTGQPIEFAGERCMLFSFRDIEETRQADAARRQSDAGFSTLFRLAPVPMLLCSREWLDAGEQWRVLEINQAFTNLLGYPHNALRHRLVSQVGLTAAQSVQENLVETLNAGKPAHGQSVSWISADKQRLDGLLSAACTVVDGNNCVLLTFRDTTERLRSETDMLSAIDAVMEDTSWFSHTLMDKLAQVRKPAHADNGLACLTKRERDVLTRVCQGHTDEQITTALSLSRHTVRNHIANLFDKTGIDHRSALVVWGRERGLGISDP